MPYSININHHNVEVLGEFISEFPFNIHIKIFSNYNDINITNNDNIVLFNNKENNDSFFSYFGVVLEKKIISNKEREKEATKNTINMFDLKIRIDGLLTENNTIKYLTYSLYKTDNYLKPWKQYNRSYAFLYKEDFVSIINGKIFLSRTAFGTIVNSLPKFHRLSFLQYFVENEPETYFGVNDFVKGWQILKEYIYYHILQPTEFLISSYETFIKLAGGEESSQVAFVDDENKKVDNIKEHLAYVGVIDTTDKQQETDQLDEEYLTDIEVGLNELAGSEIDYNKYFMGKPWPIAHEL